MRNEAADDGVNESSVELVVAYVDGDDSAAADRIYYRHRDSILRQAREGMSIPLRQRIDPEDIYQSVSMILLDGLRQGRFRIQRAGDLRALMAQLTRQRILKKAELHSAARRAVDRESSLMPDDQLSRRCLRSRMHRS